MTRYYLYKDKRGLEFRNIVFLNLWRPKWLKRRDHVYYYLDRDQQWLPLDMGWFFNYNGWKRNRKGLPKSYKWIRGCELVLMELPFKLKL